MKDSFRKYAAYAFGELLMVVLGILIALQIDNWNEDRKERATLQSYLESIARNMHEDLAELRPLRTHRMESLFAAFRFDALRNRDSHDVDEIFFLHHLRALSAKQSFFSANTSGFNEGLGLPDIVSQGRPALETCRLGSIDPPSEPFVFRFNSLEMRGEERLLVHVKDADYPDDRPPMSVELTLDSDWKSYEIDLAKFKPNDMSRLHAVLGFLIYPAEDPPAFSVRKARYH